MQPESKATIETLQAALNKSGIPALQATAVGEFLRLDTLGFLDLGMSAPIWAFFREGDIPQTLVIQKPKGIPHGLRYALTDENEVSVGHVFEFPSHYYVRSANNMFAVSKSKLNTLHSGVTTTFRFPLMGAFHNQFATVLVSLTVNELIPNFITAREQAMFRDLISRQED